MTENKEKRMTTIKKNKKCNKKETNEIIIEKGKKLKVRKKFQQKFFFSKNRQTCP